MNDSDIAARIAEAAGAKQLGICVAESLTAGALASSLGAAPNASDWFLGGVVAYATSVKQAVLGVEPGPVVSERCAAQMAEGVRVLLGADISVSTTGAGGPDPQDGQPVGTVFVAVDTRGVVTTTEHHFDGDPREVVAHTVSTALQYLLTALRDEK
jgi:nicotinamide-nucleotide amidase